MIIQWNARTSENNQAREGLIRHKKAIAANAAMAEGKPEFRISFRLEDSSYFYTYEFYRFSDRCVAVSLFRTNSKGEAVKSYFSRSSPKRFSWGQ